MFKNYLQLLYRNMSVEPEGPIVQPIIEAEPKFIILSDHELTKKERQLFMGKLHEIVRDAHTFTLDQLVEFKYLYCNLVDPYDCKWFNMIRQTDAFRKYNVISFTERPSEFNNVPVDNNITKLPDDVAFEWQFYNQLLGIEFKVTPKKMKILEKIVNIISRLACSKSR